MGVLCLDLLPEFVLLFFDFELDFSLLISNSFSSAFLNLFIDFHISRIKVIIFLIPVQLPSSFSPLFSSSVQSHNDVES